MALQILSNACRGNYHSHTMRGWGGPYGKRRFELDGLILLLGVEEDGGCLPKKLENDLRI